MFNSFFSHTIVLANSIDFLSISVPENVNRLFSNPSPTQVPDVASMDICVALCVNEPGCVAVTRQPTTGNCWLKNKRFGAKPQPRSDVNSMNLNCKGYL